MRTSPFVLFMIFLFTLASSARAEDGDLTRNTDAVQHGARGLEAFRAEDWEGAYRRFHAAESLAHSPVFLLFMARARAMQGAFAEALDLYAQVSDQVLPVTAPEAWRVAVKQARLERDELMLRLRNIDRTKTAEQVGVTQVQQPKSRGKPQKPHGEKTRSPNTASKRAALASAVIGAAGLVLGTVAGIRALVELNDIKEDCAGSRCDLADAPRSHDVHRWGRLSDLGFVVAGTGFATAAVFLWVVPTGKQAQAQSATTTFRLSARVSF